MECFKGEGLSKWALCGILLVVIRSDETKLDQMRLAKERLNLKDGSSRGKFQDPTRQVPEKVISSSALRIVHI